jgi:hypothetical protein
MIECYYLARRFKGDGTPDNPRVTREECSLTGHPCLTDPVGYGENCLRKHWAEEYQAKFGCWPPSPSPSDEIGP